MILDEKLKSFGDEMEQFNNGTTDRVKRLIELLLCYQPKQYMEGINSHDSETMGAFVLENADLNLRGIIFVKRRSETEVRTFVVILR